MNYVELLMNNPPNTKLDLHGTTDIDLQYSIADIRDISKRNSPYSKTILLSGSKNNNYWLGNLYDINADFTSYNLNKKTECKLTVNSETVIDGFFQLKAIRKVPTDDNHGFYVIYEIVIYNKPVDLMAELGEKTLADLDMSRYNHIFNFDSIVNSWNHTYKDGYVYNLTGTNEPLNLYKADWLYPSMFSWVIFDKMLSEAKFGWKGSFKNNKQFQHEIICPVIDGRPKITEENRVSRSFKAGRVDDQSWETIWTVPNGNPWWSYISTNNPLQINNKTDMDFFDNDNNFDTSTYQWTVNKNGTYTVDYDILTKFMLSNQSGSDSKFINLDNLSQIPVNGHKNFKIISSVYKNGVSIPSTTSEQYLTYRYTDNGGLIPNGTTFDFNDELIHLSSSSDEMNLVIGDVLELRIVVTVVSSRYGWDNDLTMSQKLLSGSYLENNPMTSDITQGDMIEMKSFLPDKVKLTDMVKDLVARYNLYIELDPDNDRLLIIDSRTDYYERGGSDDWTDLKDYSSEDNIQFLSELQTKKIKWTYKDDSDYSNKSYKDITGDTYGQYTHIFDNDFVMGEKKIESPFSPTPLVKTSFGAILPFIDPESPKVNTRILYYGGLKPSPSVWTLEHQDIVNGGTTETNFNKYPYSGHLDDPINPTLDINFGVCKFYYFTDNNFLTSNNMYNAYWSDYVSQIEEGRMVTSKFYLTEDKIRHIRNNLNTKIFVKDSWFYINKISSYKPLENGLTNVELIKIIETPKFKPQPIGGKVIGRVPGISIGATVKDGRKILKDKIGFNNDLNVGSIVSGNNNKGGGNVVSKVDTIYNLPDWILDTGFWDDNGFWRDTAKWYDTDPGIVGYTSSVGMTNSYIIRPNRQIIIGDNNTVSRDLGLILGDNNIIEAENSSVINGSGNTISIDGTNTTLIQASDMNVVEPDRVYLGASFSVDVNNGDMFIGSDPNPVIITGQNLSETLDRGNHSGHDIIMTSTTLLKGDSPLLYDNWIDLNNSRMIKIYSDDGIVLDSPNVITKNLDISDGGTFVNRIETESLSDNRLIKFPDKSGTVALVSDISSKLLNIVEVTDNYTIQVDDDIILFEASDPNKVITLPPSLDNVGRVIRIKSGGSYGITINVDDPSTEKVNNGNTYMSLEASEQVMLISRPESGSVIPIKGWITF